MDSNTPENPESTKSGNDRLPAAVDFERLREVTGDDEALFREISAQYLDQADEILNELEQTVRTANHEEISKLAHKLAGSSATCGMNAVVGALNAIEALKPGQIPQARDLLEEVKLQMERIRQALDHHS